MTIKVRRVRTLSLFYTRRFAPENPEGRNLSIVEVIPKRRCRLGFSLSLRYNLCTDPMNIRPIQG